MYEEQIGQVHHAEYNIQKEREYDKFHEKLQQEFRILDRNHDGTLTVDELIEYLNEKVILYMLW